MDTSKDYYKILGIQPDAVPEEIKSAFRRMAKLYSPDVNHAAEAMSRFENILEAWEVLGRPSSRVEYDMSRGFWFDGKVYTKTQVGGADGRRYAGFGGADDMPGGRSSWYAGEENTSRPPSWDFQRRTAKGAPQQGASGRADGASFSGGFQGGSDPFRSNAGMGNAYGGQWGGADNMRSPNGAGRDDYDGMRQGADASRAAEGVRLSRREAERRRMAEEMRRQHRDEVEGYFEDGGILLPVVISFVVLASIGLLLILRYGEMYFGVSGAALSSYSGIAKFVVSAMAFTLLFWLAFWLVSLFMRPPDMSIRRWSKAAAGICALICGSLYGLWMMYLSCGEIKSGMTDFAVWAVPFMLTFFISPFLMRRER